MTLHNHDHSYNSYLDNKFIPFKLIFFHFRLTHLILIQMYNVPYIYLLLIIFCNKLIQSFRKMKALFIGHKIDY